MRDEPERLKPYPKRSDVLSLAVVSAHLLFVLLPVFLAAAREPSALHLAFAGWFGLALQGLLNLLHECAHLHVFKRRQGSEWLARWVLAPLMVVSFERYRKVHWAHHHELGTEHDPKYSYRIDIGGVRFVAFVVRSLLLVEAARKLVYVHGGAARSRSLESAKAKRAHSSEPADLWWVRTAIFHLLFIGSLLSCAIFFGSETLEQRIARVAIAYGVVYLYGLLAFTVLAANLRAIAEHQARGDEDDRSGAAALRNLSTNPLSRLIFGAYGFSEHATHHWNPGVPYYHLLAETRKWVGKKPHALPRHGYGRALYEAIVVPHSRHERAPQSDRV